MNREEFKILLDKYQQNECTEEETKELLAYIDEMAAAGEVYVFSSTEEKEEIKKSIKENIDRQVSMRSRGFIWKRWYSYAAAACIMLFVAGVYFLQGNPKTIVISSAAGKIIKHQLPDGSIAWLNSASEISYKTDFAGKRSLQLLKGEVFFEVKKDAVHPFVIASNEINTTVKGTSFSVKLIDQSGDVKVSVVTGRVAVSKEADTLAVLLPRQRLKYNHTNGTALKDSALYAEANGWVNGEVLMQNASLAEISQWLQNDFGLTVINKVQHTDAEYYVQVNRNINATDAVHILNLLGRKKNIHFTLTNKTVIIQ